MNDEHSFLSHITSHKVIVMAQTCSFGIPTAEDCFIGAWETQLENATDRLPCSLSKAGDALFRCRGAGEFHLSWPRGIYARDQIAAFTTDEIREQ